MTATGFSRLSPRDFEALAESWGFQKDPRKGNAHPTMSHPEHPGAKLRYSHKHSKGHGGTVPYACLGQAATILGLPTARDFAEGPERWEAWCKTDAIMEMAYADAIASAGTDAVEMVDVEPIIDPVSRQRQGFRFQFRRTDTEPEETEMPTQEAAVTDPIEQAEAAVSAALDGLVACPECGATESKTNRPFDASSLATHRVSHGVWTCPACEVSMPANAKGSHAAACLRVAPTRQVACGLCSTKTQAKNLGVHLGGSCGAVKAWRKGLSFPALEHLDDLTARLLTELPDWALLDPDAKVPQTVGPVTAFVRAETTEQEADAVMELMLSGKRLSWTKVSEAQSLRALIADFLAGLA